MLRPAPPAGSHLDTNPVDGFILSEEALRSLPLVGPGIGGIGGRFGVPGCTEGFLAAALATAASQSNAFVEDKRVFVMEAIGRKGIVLLVLMGQAGLGKVIESSIEVVGTEKVIFEAGRQKLRIGVFSEIRPHLSFQEFQVAAFGSHGYLKDEPRAGNASQIEFFEWMYDSLTEFMEFQACLGWQRKAADFEGTILETANDPPERHIPGGPAGNSIVTRTLLPKGIR